MVKVFKNVYGGDTVEVKSFNGDKEAFQFIADEAQRLNYGMFRFWVHKNWSYFDCGPITYKMEGDVSEAFHKDFAKN